MGQIKKNAHYYTNKGIGIYNDNVQLLFIDLSMFKNSDAISRIF